MIDEMSRQADMREARRNQNRPHASCEMNVSMQESRKDDADKLSMSMVPVDALNAVLEVYAIGAKKYGRDNWLKGMEWHRVYDAAHRHLMAWWQGETFDPEDRQRHLASVAWCAITLMAYQNRGIGKDDRGVNTG